MPGKGDDMNAVQKQLTELADDVKKMTSSISILVKALTPNSAVKQSDLFDNGADPQMVQGTADLLRVIEASQKGDNKRPREDQPGASSSTTYVVDEVTREFLNITFALKKPMENKEQLHGFDTPNCDVIRCPKTGPDCGLRGTLSRATRW